MLRKIEGKKRRQQRIRWVDGITNSGDINLSRLKIVKDREAWSIAVYGPNPHLGPITIVVKSVVPSASLD